MPGLVPVELLALRAEERPDVDFLVMDDVRLSYGAVDELANRWASALAELDVVSLDPSTASDTLGVLLKYQDDIARIEGSKAKELIDEVRAQMRAAE